MQRDRTVKNTHPTLTIALEIIDEGYVVLGPGQSHSFTSESCERVIKYKVYGNSAVFTIQPEQENIFPARTLPIGSVMTTGGGKDYEHVGARYKVMVKEIKMSFKESKQDF